MANWVVRQSGNPKKRARRGKTVREMARVISQERVEFTDASGTLFEETATYSRLERLVRVLWTQALDGDMKAIRCLLEYMEGRPVVVAVEGDGQGAGVTLTGDDLFRLMRSAVERVEAWRQGNESASGEDLPQEAGRPQIARTGVPEQGRLFEEEPEVPEEPESPTETGEKSG